LLVAHFTLPINQRLKEDLVNVQASSFAGIELYHLQLELQRLDLRLQRAIDSWRLAGQDDNDGFRGRYVSDEEAANLITRPLATHWGHTAALPPEIEQHYTHRTALIERELDTVRADASELGHVLPLIHLQDTFGLSRFELDALLLCLAPSMDLRYERIYAYLQDDIGKKRPTVNLVLDLLAEPGVTRLSRLAHFSAEAPLLSRYLVEMQRPAAGGSAEMAPLLSYLLHVDEGLLAWLLGSYRPHPTLADALTFNESPSAGSFFEARMPPSPLPESEPLEGRTAYLFHGADAGRQHVAAHRLAAANGRPLIVLEMPRVVQSGETGVRRAIRLVLRDALLTGALPMFRGWDACLVDGDTPVDLLRDLLAHPGPVVIAGQSLWQPRGLERQRRITEVAFPVPGFTERRQLWAHTISAVENQERADLALTLDELAGQFMLSSLQIRDAVATARDHTPSPDAPLSAVELFAAARAHSNPRLATLAHKLVPRYTWEDIVLPDDQRALLREVVDTVRGRPQVLDAWGVGDKLASSRGITVLFAGPPGTGKTMAAEIIAGEMGLDLYKIDLSTVVSKYIGETEKNISRIFQEAEQSNAILFFDEADALFGKRSEVKDSHDRYANIEISYLLQRMEAYDGVTILATNLRSNLDDAFTRRLQFAVNFPFPDAEERLRIWKTLFPPDLPQARDIDFSLLAERFRLAGGNIRNVILSAAYLAAADEAKSATPTEIPQQVTMAHLLHGTRRELQKMGRLVRDEDLLADGGRR
jgi:hypothetical protein